LSNPAGATATLIVFSNVYLN